MALKRTDVDYLTNRAAYDALAEKVVYTGTIDSWVLIINAVSLSTEASRFETEVLDTPELSGRCGRQLYGP